MLTTRWLASGLALLLGVWIIILDWQAPFRKVGASLIPLLGGLLVAVAFVVVPVDELNSLWWLPLVIDLGCVPLLTLSAGFVIYRLVAKSFQRR